MDLSGIPADPSLSLYHSLPPLLSYPGPKVTPRSLAKRADADAPFANLNADLAWSVTTHTLAAAWPRTRCRSAQNRTLPFQLSIHHLGRSGRSNTREEARWLDQHQRSPVVEISDPSAYEDQEQLWIAVNRYAPKVARSGGYTAVIAHAGGFYKESFETALATLLASPQAELIDEIWSLDCASNGDSGVLNRQVLGDTFSWIDNGRDVTNFLLRHLPAKGSSPNPPPTYLPELDVGPELLLLDWREEKKAISRPWRGHHLIGFGQSFGGAALALAELGCPGIFSGMVFLDAMLVQPIPEDQIEVATQFRANAAAGVLARRDHWPSREAAYESLRNNGGLSAWTDDVLQRYVAHALIDVDNGVELKCRKADEAMLFIESHNSVSAAGHRLPDFSDELGARTHFILARKNGSWVLDEHQEMNQAACRGSTVDRVKAGHLVVQTSGQEDPEGCARSLAAYFGRLGPPPSSARAKL